MVEITWLDIVATPHRWDEIDPAELHPIQCRQLGYLAVDEPDRVVLVNTVSDDHGTGGATAIPRGCVLLIHDVQHA